MKTFPRWVEISYLPVELLNFEALVEIGNKFGTFLGLEENFHNSTRVRMLLDMDSSISSPKPLELISRGSTCGIKEKLYNGGITGNVIMTKEDLMKFNLLCALAGNNPRVNIKFNQDKGGFSGEADSQNQDIDEGNLANPISKEVSHLSPDQELTNQATGNKKGSVGKLEGFQKCTEGERQEHIPRKLEMFYEIMGLNSDPESKSELEYDTEDENNKVLKMEKQKLIKKILELDFGKNLHWDTQENLMVEGNSFPNAKIGIGQNCPD
ncbi:hypothetical protein SUGI_0511980 [Cryptomeria japonica]|nr:hypothetical protein SUGI_0511980 [Cryptomeria japonica]